jgi:cyclase
LQNGWIVQSNGFKKYMRLGNPVTSVKRFSEWDADELIYLDISKDDTYDLNRDDIANPNRSSVLDIYADVAHYSFMPITFGGRIKSMKDAEDRIRIGADKVSINTLAIEKPEMITEIAKKFGSQCAVVSIDVKTIEGKKYVFSHCGRIETKVLVVDWAKKCQDLGAGELFINSIDMDGKRLGFDIELYQSLKDIKIPIIACGGAGEWEHFEEVLRNTDVDAVAAANIFQHVDQSMYLVRKYLHEQGCNVRPARSNSLLFQR